MPNAYENHVIVCNLPPENRPPPHPSNVQQYRPPLLTGFPPAFQAGGGGAEPPAVQSCGHSSSRLCPAPAADVWEPPSQLQHIIVPVPEAASYTLFFPIELTNKDYLRRVFDVVAMGIQGTVRRMIGKYGQRIGPIGSQEKKFGHAEYDFSKTCDLYYLTKHIAHEASAPVYARGLQPLFAVPAAYHITSYPFLLFFPAEFGADQRQLVEACKVLKGCRCELMHVNVDSGSLENLSSSFEAGRRLLAFFPANEALAALASLEAQFNDHKAFKNRRMAALGWRFGSSVDAAVPAAPTDPHKTLVDGRVAAQRLQEILDDPMCKHAVDALSILSSAAKECDKRIHQETSLSHYAEAKRLQVRPFLPGFYFV